MSLVELQNFLNHSNGANLSNIANCFNMNAFDMRLILDHWVKKGRVGYRACQNGCSGCDGCPMLELNGEYHWL